MPIHIFTHDLGTYTFTYTGIGAIQAIMWLCDNKSQLDKPAHRLVAKLISFNLNRDKKVKLVYHPALTGELSPG